MISPVKLSSQSILLDDQSTYALETEGDLKIVQVRPLQLYPFYLLIPIIILYSVFTCLLGLIAMKYYIRIRAFVLYRNASNFHQATHVLITGSDEILEIQNIIEKQNQRFFFYRKLKYVQSKTQNGFIPLVYSPKKDGHLINNNFYRSGLNSQQILKRQQIYGKNIHPVQIPGYWEYLGEQMLKGFFLIQYLLCVVYIIERNYQFAGILIGFSVLTTSINYFLRKSSFTKVKEIAETNFQITVLRNGNRININSTQIVPGDIFFQTNIIPCDAIIVKGQAYLNQMNLTGQTLPIHKYPAQKESQWRQTANWVYQGSILLDSRGQTTFLAIHTGFHTHKGSIIRRILHHNPIHPDFVSSGIKFLFIMFVLGYIVFFAMLKLMLSKHQSSAMITLRGLDLIGWTVPASYPIYFNLCYTASLVRLGRKGVEGNQAQKTIISGKVKTVCFDKTGTITQNNMNLYSIIRFLANDTFEKILAQQSQIQLDQSSLIMKLFASCHTVRKIKEQFLGDQLDLRMFEFSKFYYQNPLQQNIKLSVSKNRSRLEVLKINQFQSRLQSMSVLVKDIQNNKHYIFVKGAPEKLLKFSSNKPKKISQLIIQIQLTGLRTLAFGYKQIKDPKEFLNVQREAFQKNIQILGLVSFENKVKQDTPQTIKLLHDAQIQTKIITGDSIYIAIEAGIRSGIIKTDQKVLLLTGDKQTAEQNGKYIGTIFDANKVKMSEDQIILSFHQYQNQTMTMAIDGNFLKLNNNIKIPKTTKVFARMDPSSKSLIIKKLKQNYEQQNQLKLKVAMVGDGANDLMAIKQADIGIGINQTDAAFASDFAITQIKSVDTILREGKGTLANIIQIYRYYGIINFLKITFSMIMLYDNSYVSGNQLTYLNYASTLWIALFCVLSAPTSKLSHIIPNDNLMGLANFLIYWGQTIIGSGGLILCYWYGTQAPFFELTPDKNYTQWVFSSHTNTIVFLCVNLILICVIFWVYLGSPFKQPIWRNYVQIIFLTIIVILNIAIFFITRSGFMGMIFIPLKYAGALLGLTLLTVGLGGIYALILHIINIQNSDKVTHPVEQ